MTGSSPASSTVGWFRRYSTFLVMIGLTIVGGGNPVAVRISNRELAPLWGASIRFVLAAAIFWAVVVFRKAALPRGQTLRSVLVFGALQYGAHYALIYWGLLWVPAGLGQTVLGIVPLATLLIAVMFGQEKLRRRGIIGALFAALGIFVIAGAPTATNLPGTAILALVGSAFCVGLATVLARSLRETDPFTINAIAMSVGGTLLFASSNLAGEVVALPSSLATVISVGYLVLFGSVAVFTMYLYILKYWPASMVSYAFVIYPFWAILLSVMLDNEQISGLFILGGFLTLAGVWISRFPLGPARSEP